MSSGRSKQLKSHIPFAHHAEKSMVVTQRTFIKSDAHPASNCSTEMPDMGKENLATENLAREPAANPALVDI